jgi:hypothetical protein
MQDQIADAVNTVNDFSGDKLNAHIFVASKGEISRKTLKQSLNGSEVYESDGDLKKRFIKWAKSQP